MELLCITIAFVLVAVLGLREHNRNRIIMAEREWSDDLANRLLR